MAPVPDSGACDRWQEELLRGPAREQPPTTISGQPVQPLYTPDLLPGFDYESDLGYPGQFPFARGGEFRGHHT